MHNPLPWFLKCCFLKLRKWTNLHLHVYIIICSTDLIGVILRIVIVKILDHCRYSGLDSARHLSTCLILSMILSPIEISGCALLNRVWFTYVHHWVVAQSQKAMRDKILNNPVNFSENTNLYKIWVLNNKSFNIYLFHKCINHAGV